MNRKDRMSHSRYTDAYRRLQTSLKRFCGCHGTNIIGPSNSLRSWPGIGEQNLIAVHRRRYRWKNQCCKIIQHTTCTYKREFIRRSSLSVYFTNAQRIIASTCRDLSGISVGLSAYAYAPLTLLYIN